MGRQSLLTEASTLYPEIVIGFIDAGTRNRRIRGFVSRLRSGFKLCNFCRVQKLSVTVMKRALHRRVGGKIPDSLQIRRAPLR